MIIDTNDVTTYVLKVNDNLVLTKPGIGDPKPVMLLYEGIKSSSGDGEPGGRRELQQSRAREGRLVRTEPPGHMSTVTWSKGDMNMKTNLLLAR